jgi:hypothetical protein
MQVFECIVKQEDGFRLRRFDRNDTLAIVLEADSAINEKPALFGWIAFLSGL